MANEQVVPFKAASATSTNVGTDPAEFEAKKALDHGSGYWCSSGNHSKMDVVVWTGAFSRPQPISGLELTWNYSPEEVREIVYAHRYSLLSAPTANPRV